MNEEQQPTWKQSVGVLKPNIDIENKQAGFSVTARPHIVGTLGTFGWTIPLWELVSKQLTENDDPVFVAKHVLDEWVKEMFPSFVKLGPDYYHPDESIIVKETDDEVSRHPVSGTLFRLHTKEELLEPNTWLVADYECIDNNAEMLAGVKAAVVDKKESDEFYYALVRRYTPTGFKYYPLPLVFASPIERRMAAQESGKAQPAEQWVQRRRRAVMRVLDQPRSQ